MMGPLRAAQSAARSFVRGIDAILSAYYGVHPFTNDAGCILRISSWKVERTMILDDGTELHPGDSLLALHLWNERMTALASHLGELGRSRILLDDFTYSLQLLAAALQAEVFSAAPAGIYAEFGFTEQDRSAERVFRRLGFTVRIKEDPGLRFWRRAFWENFYAWMLMWTYAPGTLKGKEMTKLKRIQVWISYTQFLDRFLFHTPA